MTCPANVTYTGSALTPCNVAVTGVGGLSLAPTPTYLNNIVGLATASYTYAGDANHLGSSGSKTFLILYASAGLCDGEAGHQILQPINADGSSVFKNGSTVPAKFRVCDGSGHSIGTPGLVLSFFNTGTSIAGSVPIDESIYSNTPDTQFRWDPTAQQWIFNMSTKGLKQGVTYFYLITLNDTSTISFQFTLK